MARRNRRANNEITIIGIPFVDMLTAMVGILILVLGFIVSKAITENPEKVREINVYIPVDTVHIGDTITIPISVTGGLEKYVFDKKDDPERCQDADVKGLPHGVELNAQGVLEGVVAADNETKAAYRTCVGITVTADGSNAELLALKDRLMHEGKEKEFEKHTEHYEILRFTVLPSLAQVTRLPDAEIGKTYKQFIKINNGNQVAFSGLSFNDDNHLPAQFILPNLNSSHDGLVLTWEPQFLGKLNFRLKYTNNANGKIEFLSDEFEIITKPLQTDYKKPTIAELELPTAYRHKDYVASFTVMDGQAPFIWEANGLPPGLTLNKDTGAISGTYKSPIEPAGSKSQKYHIQVSLTDKQNQTASLNTILTVHERIKEIPKLTIKTTQQDFDQPRPQVGEDFNLSLTSEGGDASQIFWQNSLSRDDIGLQVDGNIITGTATNAVDITLQAMVSDQIDSDKKTFTLHIQPAELAFDAPESASGVVGRKIKPFSVDIIGGISPYHWEAVNLPAGLTQRYTNNNKTATIEGIPQSPGNTVITFNAQDTSGSKASGEIKLVIAEQLQITTEKLVNGTVGMAYSDQLRAKGGVPPYLWSLSQAETNRWLKIQSDGSLSGIPTQANTNRILVKVTDKDNISFEKTVDLIIEAQNKRPSLPEPKVRDFKDCDFDEANTPCIIIFNLGSVNTESKMELGKNRIYNKAEVSAGELPKGMTVSIKENHLLVFEGFPNKTGRFGVTIKIDGDKEKRFIIEKPSLWKAIALEFTNWLHSWFVTPLKNPKVLSFIISSPLQKNGGLDQ